MSDEIVYSSDVTAEEVDRLIAIRDLWQIVARQIERRLTAEDFTGRIEINVVHSKVRNYQPTPVLIPEEEERRVKERRAAERDGDDRRQSNAR